MSEQRTIEVSMSIGLVGCTRTFKIKVERDCSDDEIWAEAEDAARERLDVSWKAVD